MTKPTEYRDGYKDGYADGEDHGYELGKEHTVKQIRFLATRSRRQAEQAKTANREPTYKFLSKQAEEFELLADTLEDADLDDL